MKTRHGVILSLLFLLIVGIVALVAELSRLESRVNSLFLQTNYLQNYIEPRDYYDTTITVLVKTSRGLSYQKFDSYDQICSYITMLKTLAETKEGLTNGK